MQTATDKPKFYILLGFDPPKVERGPCPRNREIFDAVRFQHLSIRAAAEQFKLSKSRIGQIVDQVGSWIGRTGGGPVRTWREQLRLSEYIHRERLERRHADALRAFNEGISLKSEKVIVIKNEPERREYSFKDTKGDIRFQTLAWKIETARQQFEDSRPAPPDVDQMTSAERLREVMVTAEEMARQMAEARADKTDEESPTPPVEQVGDLPAAAEEIVEEQFVDVAPPSMTEDEESRTTDALPPCSAAGRLQTCRTAAWRPPRRKDPLEGVDLSQYAPLPPPDPYRHLPREYPNTPDGLPPPMILIEKPTAEELEQYWILEEGLPTWRPPTILGKRDPRFDIWQRYQPLPPNSAMRKKKK